MTDLRDLDKNMPILIVDDYSTVRRVVKNCLSGLGFKNIIEAEDFAGAQAKMSEQSVKLVISDFKLPDVLDSNALVSFASAGNQLPILLVVNENQKKELLAKSNIKKEQLLVKPFTMQMLQEKIQAVI